MEEVFMGGGWGVGKRRALLSLQLGLTDILHCLFCTISSLSGGIGGLREHCILLSSQWDVGGTMINESALRSARTLRASPLNLDPNYFPAIRRYDGVGQSEAQLSFGAQDLPPTSEPTSGRSFPNSCLDLVCPMRRARGPVLGSRRRGEVKRESGDKLMSRRDR
ncbi:hypothetical protein PoB_000124400 [Plakobranchus ocellatus]|uniref:Uncharacterized protein n=1 Tax=Plakobranchus ocellatus TaxID=259542 RepID=A0AAV3XY98_9GAST|nr:hypothetical protein PoB_000124400 [Plakobranchus ocellatus]